MCFFKTQECQSCGEEIVPAGCGAGTPHEVFLCDFARAVPFRRHTKKTSVLEVEAEHAAILEALAPEDHRVEVQCLRSFHEHCQVELEQWLSFTSAWVKLQAQWEIEHDQLEKVKLRETARKPLGSVAELFSAPSSGKPSSASVGGYPPSNPYDAARPGTPPVTDQQTTGLEDPTVVRRSRVELATEIVACLYYGTRRRIRRAYRRCKKCCRH